MRLVSPLLVLSLLAAPSLAGNSAFTLDLNQSEFAPSEEIVLTVSGLPDQFGFLMIDSDTTPNEILPGLVIDMGFSANFMVYTVVLPSTGTLDMLCEMDCELAAIIQGKGSILNAQAVSVDPIDASLCVSNLTSIDASNTYGFCGPCDECKGGVSALTMRYIGPGMGYVEVVNTGKKPATHFAGNLQPGEVFSFMPADGKDTFGKEIELLVDGQTNATAHTSCSKPIGPGAVFGDFRVLMASSKDNGAICPVENPGPATDCTAGKPLKLEFKYTGGDCSASDNDQSADKATCDGDPGMLQTVHIVASGKKGDVYFCDAVNLGETFWIDPELIGSSKIDNSLIIDISDENDNWLQTVTLHASCSQPLAVGNVFGGVELVTFVPKP